MIVPYSALDALPIKRVTTANVQVAAAAIVVVVADVLCALYVPDCGLQHYF